MKTKQAGFLIVFGILSIGFLYGVLIEPCQVKVRQVRIKNSGLSKVLTGKTALHVSDLHLTGIGEREEKILAIIKRLQPDLIFLTGDYVTWNGDYGPALTLFSRLKARNGVWAVMGDYDYSCSRKSCLFCHERGSGSFVKGHDVRFLRNRVERICLKDGSVWLGGIDPGAEFDFSNHEKVSLPEGKTPAIILSHSPLIFDCIDQDQDVLILAGDTHGGQICLPPWLWNVLGYKKCSLYRYGLFQKGRKMMYVSSGIGTSHVPIRLFQPPEVVVFHF